MKSITLNAFRTIATVVTAALVVTLVVVGVRASTSPTESASVGAPTSAEELEQVVATVATDDEAAALAADLTPADRSGLRKMRADLKAARALSGSERKAALVEIRDNARAGDYGDAVQRRVERRADRREIVRALLPEELKADLAAVKAAPQEERAALRAQLLSDALDGKYGENVQAAARKLQELRDH